MIDHRSIPALRFAGFSPFRWSQHGQLQLQCRANRAGRRARRLPERAEPRRHVGLFFLFFVDVAACDAAPCDAAPSRLPCVGDPRPLPFTLTRQRTASWVVREIVVVVQRRQRVSGRPHGHGVECGEKERVFVIP